MTGKINWRRSGYQTRIRGQGSINLSDERDRLDNDRAARWLNKRLNSKPRAPSRNPLRFMGSTQ
jgi:hypothetical protein